MIEGKSTIARQVLMVHVTAGFGDIGFKGKWTLELYALRDIELTIGQRICQIYWHEAKGTGPMYNGKYQNAQGVEGAK
jgi:dCTP deaminase